MKKAVAYLLPFMEAEKHADAKPQARIVMATVKETGTTSAQNIVGVVLQCNNYEVIDSRDGPGGEDSGDGAREKKADIAAERADYAVAR